MSFTCSYRIYFHVEIRFHGKYLTILFWCIGTAKANTGFLGNMIKKKLVMINKKTQLFLFFAFLILRKYVAFTDQRPVLMEQQGGPDTDLHGFPAAPVVGEQVLVYLLSLCGRDNHHGRVLHAHVPAQFQTLLHVEHNPSIFSDDLLRYQKGEIIINEKLKLYVIFLNK